MKTKKSKKEQEREELERIADVLLKEDNGKSEDIFDRGERVSYQGVEIDDPYEGRKTLIFFEK